MQLLRGLMTLPAPRASRRLLQRCEYERAPQAACDLDVHENVLRKWVKEFAADPRRPSVRHAGAWRGLGTRVSVPRAQA